jgi:hypothetical protein
MGMTSGCPVIIEVRELSLEKCKTLACSNGAHAFNFNSICQVVSCWSNDLQLTSASGTGDVYVLACESNLDFAKFYLRPLPKDPNECATKSCVNGSCRLFESEDALFDSSFYSPDVYEGACFCDDGFEGELCDIGINLI